MNSHANGSESEQPHLRIAMVVGAFPTVSETFIVNQIVGLLALGHQVDVISLSGPRPGPVHEQIIRHELLKRTLYLRNDALTPLGRYVAMLRRISSTPGWITRKGLSLLLKIFRAHGEGVKLSRHALVELVSLEMRNGPFDIVHCQFGDLGERWAAVTRLGLMKGRLVTSIRGHDVTQEDRFDSDYYTELFRQCRLLLPVSQSLAQRLRDLGCPGEKIEVLHSGIDCARFEFQPRSLDEQEGPVKLLSVARLVEMKGIDYAIEAVAELQRAGHRIRYDIVGDGPLRRKLESSICSRGVADAVRIHGWKSHQDLAEILREAHIFIAPSVTAANGETEGIPNAVKEAMAVGLPVVATRHSGIPELVIDGVTGLLVNERDPQALATAIATLCDQASRWPEFGRAGRAQIESAFDTVAINRRLVELYGAIRAQAVP